MREPALLFVSKRIARDTFFRWWRKCLIASQIKFNKMRLLLLTVLVGVLTSIVEGKTEKGSGGEAATVKFPAGSANVSDTTLGAVKNPPLTLTEFMKQVADMMAMMALSGGLAGMMVALKYYAMKAVKDVVDSMTGLGYADDA